MLELGLRAQAAGYRLRHVESCGSTNDLAMQALREGQDKLWIVADHQSAGRGRSGRVWAPRPGNLYCSLALRAPAEARIAPQIGFVTAVAAYDAIGAALGATDGLAIKWPNDLLLHGAKTAGILAESGWSSDRELLVVVGIGINVADHPDVVSYRATHLQAACPAVAAARVFRNLSDAMTARLEEWGADGFAPIREAWLARAAGLGGPAVVRRDDGDVRGHMIGLDVDGRLILDTDVGRRLIEAGDVFLGG